MAGEIYIRAEVLEAMLIHARSEPQIECCGLLAGRADIITNIFPAKNALESSTVYEIAPQELFPLLHEMRAQGLEHMGQYHSHLATDNFPSPRDIDLAGYPDRAYFIVSLRPDVPNPIRAFSIRDGVVREFEIVATRVPELRGNETAL